MAGNDEEALGNDNPCRNRGCGVRRRDAVDGNAGVTLESAVKIVAEAVGYTFEICKDGTVVVFKVRGAEAMGESSRSPVKRLFLGELRSRRGIGANPPR